MFAAIRRVSLRVSSFAADRQRQSLAARIVSSIEMRSTNVRFRGVERIFDRHALITALDW